MRVSVKASAYLDVHLPPSLCCYAVASHSCTPLTRSPCCCTWQFAQPGAAPAQLQPPTYPPEGAYAAPVEPQQPEPQQPEPVAPQQQQQQQPMYAVPPTQEYAAPMPQPPGEQPAPVGYAAPQPPVYPSYEAAPQQPQEGVAPAGYVAPQPPYNGYMAPQEPVQNEYAPQQPFAYPPQQAPYEPAPEAAPQQAEQQQAPAEESPATQGAGGSQPGSPLSPIGLNANGAGAYGESSAVLSGGSQQASGGTLWKLFTASDGSKAPPAVPGVSGAASATGSTPGLSQSGDGLTMGGDDDSDSDSDSDDSMSGGEDDSDNGGSGGVPDPSAILGKSTSTSAARKLAPAAKAQIAAQMQALRQSIMGDFKSTLDMGQQAGYLPPPPVA
jgi:hypothetical protein